MLSQVSNSHTAACSLLEGGTAPFMWALDKCLLICLLKWQRASLLSSVARITYFQECFFKRKANVVLCNFFFIFLTNFPFLNCLIWSLFRSGVLQSLQSYNTLFLPCVQSIDLNITRLSCFLLFFFYFLSSKYVLWRCVGREILIVICKIDNIIKILDKERKRGCLCLCDRLQAWSFLTTKSSFFIEPVFKGWLCAWSTVH